MVGEALGPDLLSVYRSLLPWLNLGPNGSPHVSPSLSVHVSPAVSPPVSRSTTPSTPSVRPPNSTPPTSPPPVFDDILFASLHPLPTSVDHGDDYIVVPISIRPEVDPLLSVTQLRSPWFYLVHFSSTGHGSHSVYLTFDRRSYSSPPLIDFSSFSYQPPSFVSHSISLFLLPPHCVWSSVMFPFH
jgi:hypothetical protein